MGLQKITITFIISIVLISCSTLKNKSQTSKITKKEVYRKADTLKYSVPKAVYKDTTIYIRNFEKQSSNTLKIVYDKKGNESQIDCISDNIKELTTIIENSQQKTKESKFDYLPLFLILVGLLILQKFLNGRL